MERWTEDFDIVVIGAGHAGCEAGLAAARMGCRTLVFTINLDAVALMACNPSIGGTAKGQIVREVDALGGQMGLTIDETCIQVRMLNTSKGPAVQSLRAQADKKWYQQEMKAALERQERLSLRQGEITDILTQGGRVSGVRLASGETFTCRAVIVAAGVYLKSRVIVGEWITDSGPSGLQAASALSDVLKRLGFRLNRFKSGTPARLDGRTIDTSVMIEQPGDTTVGPFSFKNKRMVRNQVSCYLTYTTPRTHEIIRENLHRSPLYAGIIQGTGPRYCPSIEDKVVRFHDKDKHQVFIEPEGLNSVEKYAQGLSTSLPIDVQWQMYHSIPGLERAIIMRPAYAIEYDCIDPTQLQVTLESRDIPGLFFAGQINGSSGYEEAAGQGLLAGINAARFIQGKDPVILSRSQAYIGVLVDDLALKGTREPYRMMTSRAEYRLLLRHDNADRRLTELGYAIGLVDAERYDAYMRKVDAIEKELTRLRETVLAPAQDVNEYLERLNSTALKSGITLYDLLKRPEISYGDIHQLSPAPNEVPPEVAEQVEIEARYEGYIRKQVQQAQRAARMENTPLPAGMDYARIEGLRLEARQKLNEMRPMTLGQASRISGVSPADIAVLMIYLKKEGKRDG